MPNALHVSPRILTQGHLDGFCLLYSICNAYKALLGGADTAMGFVGKNMNKWTKIINISPSLHNFASGEGSNFGASTNKRDIALINSFVSNCFDALTERTANPIEVEKIDFSSVSEIDYSHSVVILCLTDRTKLKFGPSDDHWVCIVGKKLNAEGKTELLVACSFTLHHCGYTEAIDNETGRYFNNFIEGPLKKAHLCQDYIYEIRKT